MADIIAFTADKAQIISLWSSVFGDSVQDITFFIDNCTHKKCLGYFAEDKLVSMIYQSIDIKIPNLFFESTEQNIYEIIGYSYTGTMMVLDENGVGTLTIHFKKNDITKIDPIIQDGKVTGA